MLVQSGLAGFRWIGFLAGCPKARQLPAVIFDSDCQSQPRPVLLYGKVHQGRPAGQARQQEEDGEAGSASQTAGFSSFRNKRQATAPSTTSANPAIHGIQGLAR